MKNTEDLGLDIRAAYRAILRAQETYGKGQVISCVADEWYWHHNAGEERTRSLRWYAMVRGQKGAVLTFWERFPVCDRDLLVAASETVNALIIATNYAGKDVLA